MSKELVTVSQMEDVRKMANEKGIGKKRFQLAIRNGAVSHFLNGLKSDSMELLPPRGGKIHRLAVEVKLDQSWESAIREAGPYCESLNKIWTLGDKFPPEGKGLITIDLVLVNYPRGNGDMEHASEWAEKNGLYVTQPREVLTVGRQYPSLNKVLAFPEMVLKSTTGINIPTTGFDWWCCVEWKGSRRGAIIDNEVSHFSDTTWYVYKH